MESWGEPDTLRPNTAELHCSNAPCSVFLPYVANQFPAQALLARLHAGHHAAGGGDNRRSHAAEDARDFRRAHVTPQARLAHPLQADDDAFAALELELQLDFLSRLAALHQAVRDVALFLQDARDALL